MNTYIIICKIKIIILLEQKLSQEKLAFLSELHPAYIGKLERDEKYPTIETLYKIENGLKILLHKLLDIDLGTDAEENDSLHRIIANDNGSKISLDKLLILCYNNSG